MTFLQPNLKHPNSLAYYKRTSYEFQAKYLHPIHQIEFHKQASEILYSTMTNKAISVQKLQNTLENMRG